MQIENNVLFVARKWGTFLQFCQNEKATVKLIRIKKDESMHYQFHRYRSEQWYVINGKIKVTKGTKTTILEADKFCTIDIGERHKMEGIEDSLVLEIARGHFDEDDIVHLD